MATSATSAENYLNPPPNVDPNVTVYHLLRMAEDFRIRKPPKYKLCLKSLMAAKKVPCNRELMGRVEFQLGKCLWFYSKNTKLGTHHLENAYNIFKELGDRYACLQTVGLLGDIYLNDQDYQKVKSLLKGEIEVSKQYPFYHSRVLFLLADAYYRSNDMERALEVVKTGVHYFTEVQNPVIVCYFLLVKSLIYSTQSGNFQTQLGVTVGELGEILNTLPADLPELDDIRAFCYTIQLSFFLSVGLYKNGRSCLGHLHNAVQSASKREMNPKPHFRWLNSEMLTAVAYVFTVLTNVHLNNMDRAQRYYQTSIKHFETLKHCWGRSVWAIIERSHEYLAKNLEILVYQEIAPTYLIKGDSENCLFCVSRSLDLMMKDQVLFNNFNAQVHCTLGMVACFHRRFKEAESQYTIAATTANDLDLKLFSYLSMGLIFLYTGDSVNYYEMCGKITNFQSNSKNLKAILCLVNAFNSYIHGKVEDSKGHIAQCLNISRDEDMGRIQSLASLLSSTLFKARDVDAFSAGISWADKLSDGSLKLWGYSQMLENAKVTQNEENFNQANQQIAVLKASLAEDRSKIKSNKAFSLITWISDQLPN
ncbi:unnamed protein product [Bursaphelenchus xylophilus]|uniref:MAU2 chromatid cohesion factor homolog n=1 Tax=Bursaphelenchus xylophilus TaxID=6326 RepID=A0A1I7RLI2_BURXY|nr:unnamed protein product [Bursaphelenchus xylophilus]CAG9082959.1 unnamed protein product [Bursaphelenchus xylophilus]